MKTDFLKKRAKDFLENAHNLIKKGKYSLGAFNLEQAVQLFLKHYLFVRLKDFPKTHSLTQLLKDVGKAYEKEKEMEKLIDENINFIADLEEAHITFRYLPTEFYKAQVEKMEEFVKSLIEFLNNL